MKKYLNDGVHNRYNELEEKSPNSERLERLQSEGEKFEEVLDSLDTFETELEQLSFFAKTDEQRNNLIQKYLEEKKQFENTELAKHLTTMRANHTYRVFASPNMRDTSE